MKVGVLILLLGNLALLVAGQSGWLPFADEPEVRAQPPLHAEKIRLLDAAPDKPEDPVAPAPALALAPEDGPARPVCMEWGEFSGTDLARVAASLSALQPGGKLSERQIEYEKGYWVYFPPQKDKAAVNRKIAQLKARGIEEYFVVQDGGPWQNAISLGVFRTQEAAQHFLDELQSRRDVRSAQIGERASRLKTTVFVLSGLDEAAVAALAAMQKDFPGSELKHVDCAIP
jgi:hypothetical protein